MSKKTIYMFIPYESIPYDGWIQSCLCCELFTGHTYKFMMGMGVEIQYNMIAYICAKCCKSSTNLRKIIGQAHHYIN